MQKPKRVNYLSNANILAEIHRSKNTYCSFLEPQYADYAFIVRDLAEVSEAAAAYLTKHPDAEADGLVIRLMTYEHIPVDLERKPKAREINKDRAKVPFPAFKHFLISVTDDGYSFTEVGRSHWIGGFENGHFSPDHGHITDRLGHMFMKLVERYGGRGNWRGYSYNDEMQGNALVQLSKVGLQFDESKSQNPFAYYTTTITHQFTRTLNVEKKTQILRDDLLESYGMNPSMTRQVENDLGDKPKSKRGRPKKT